MITKPIRNVIGVSKRLSCPNRSAVVSRCSNIQEQIHPMFFEEFVSTICKNDFEACIQSIYVPPLEKQLELIAMYDEIQKLVDIHEVRGVVAQLLLQENHDLLLTLVNALHNFEQATLVVKGLLTTIQSM